MADEHHPQVWWNRWFQLSNCRALPKGGEQNDLENHLHDLETVDHRRSIQLVDAWNHQKTRRPPLGRTSWVQLRDSRAKIPGFMHALCKRRLQPYLWAAKSWLRPRPPNHNDVRATLIFDQHTIVRSKMIWNVTTEVKMCTGLEGLSLLGKPEKENT